MKARLAKAYIVLSGLILVIVGVAGFLGLHDLVPIQLGLNLQFNFIHLGVGVLSVLASTN